MYPATYTGYGLFGMHEPYRVHGVAVSWAALDWVGLGLPLVVKE